MSRPSSLLVGVPTETKVDEFRVALTPDGVRELGPRGRRDRRGGRRCRLQPHRRRLPAGGRRGRQDRRRRVGAGRPGLQGQGAPAPRVRVVPPRPHRVHLPAPGRLSRGGRRPPRPGRHRHRLRDRPARGPVAAPAGPDERGGRAHGGADRGPLPGAPQRRPGRAAGRGPGRAAGPGRRAGRRQRRAQRRRGWRPASRPRSTCSTATSTGCATSTRSRWAASPRSPPTGARSSGWWRAPTSSSGPCWCRAAGRRSS